MLSSRGVFNCHWYPVDALALKVTVKLSPALSTIGPDCPFASAKQNEASIINAVLRIILFFIFDTVRCVINLIDYLRNLTN